MRVTHRSIDNLNCSSEFRRKILYVFLKMHRSMRYRTQTHRSITRIYGAVRL
uniref:Uncharacterized protein n=1 Tax=Brassica oleracea var. oleracea TaxID=109376 RepID=A0A0D3CGY2_BRAOL